ncbi:trypsin-like serine peptidase [Actinophytocola xanthii]|uniref:Peptidase n=1 Tax=Actinophytocola xanthii TaxID=1912961 RepID=A0A1Q8CXD3_9PSEU|nr:trypsin-like peptidase domain-containing protein [Actinophytocola xanthii]OLF19017.1 hypothetical protein BU204_03980 [Actinophytocola xanthii]
MHWGRSLLSTVTVALSTVALSTVALSTVALALPAAAEAGGQAAEGKLVPVTGKASADLVATRNERWTQARIEEVIRTAKPIEPPVVDAPEAPQVEEPAAPEQVIAEPAAASGAAARNLPAPAAHGRMYIANADGSSTGWCSASVVNSGARNLINTAAHCLHSGAGGNWHFTEAFFVPGLHGTSQPHGIFWAQQWTVWSAWTDSSDDDYDYGFVNLFPRDDGQNVVDVVGANGLRINSAFGQTVVVWGYPANDGYPGDVPYYCDQATTYDGSASDSWVYVNCTMTGGASGGPWLDDYDYTASLGYVIALTTRAGIDFDYSLSPYFDQSVADLYYLVD